jgi:hypothetical protein
MKRAPSKDGALFICCAMRLVACSGPLRATAILETQRARLSTGPLNSCRVRDHFFGGNGIFNDVATLSQ